MRSRCRDALARDTALACATLICGRYPLGGGVGEIALCVEGALAAYGAMAGLAGQNDVTPNGPGEETRGCTPR